MNFLVLVICYFTVLFGNFYFAECKAPKTAAEKCTMCSDLVDNFIKVSFNFKIEHFKVGLYLNVIKLKGLRRTSKGNFGGGNTGRQFFFVCLIIDK